MIDILNNKLKWDGSHLGSYSDAITHQWSLEGTHYYAITLPNGWSKANLDITTPEQTTIALRLPRFGIGQNGVHEKVIPARTLNENNLDSGVIYCMAQCTKDVFPCIVEDIKSIFGIPRRGVHRIIIDGKHYIIYYVPISVKGEIVWETPLTRLDSKHLLRKNPNFRKEVQKAIAFCDILSLSSTGEPSIRIRPGVDGEYIPITVNEINTSIVKGNTYDFSILNKTLFSKWFGEETSISDIVKEMMHYQSKQMPTQNIIPLIDPNPNDNLATISTEIRSKVDKVINQYDRNYIWYSNFIVDRMSRHLLIDN